MKHFLLKSLLAIAVLCAGSVSVWGVTNLATGTGTVGATDNSSGFNVLGSKSMPLTAGDEYVITFVNYNKGADGTNYWANWAFISNVFNCRADHGESNPSWGSATNVNFTGSTWSDIYSSISQWLQAYNGVTVTLTVSRNAAGDGITIAHTATTNAVDAIASQTYAGTFTATVGAATAINFYLTVENAHLNIYKIIKTDATNGGAIYVAPEHTAGAQWGSNTGASTVDANLEHYNGDASSGWSGCAYAKFSYPDLPAGVTITSAKLSYYMIQGNNSNREDHIFSMNKDFDLNWGAFAGQTGIDLRNTASRSATYVNVATTGQKGGGKENFLEATMTSYVNSLYVEAQKYILFQWTGNAGGADLYGKGSVKAPSLEITFTQAETFTATFTEDNSLSPTVTLYSDAGRTAEIANGTLEDGTTYYYRAVCAGYLNYEGSFTVEGSDPDIHFTMRTPNIYNYVVNATNSGALLKELASGSYTEGSAAITTFFPRFILNGTTLYCSKTGAIWYSVTFTPNENDFVQEITYNAGTTANVVFYTEGEDVAEVSIGTNNDRASMGRMGHTGSVETYKNVTTLAPGKYQIYMRGHNGNSAARAYSFKVGDGEVFSGTITNGTNKDANSAEFTVSTTSTLSFASEGSSQSGIDYFYVVKTAEVGTIPSSGIGSLASAYGLNFAGASVSDGELKAYVVTEITADRAKVSPVDEMPANSGVILEGTAGATYSIPVKADATYDGTNKLQAAVTATPIAADQAYILKSGAFHKVTAASEVPAGKAYLLAEDVPAGVKALRFDFDGLATGINGLANGQQPMANGPIFNLAGQRVNKAVKGLYIVNGKKIVK